MPEVNEQIVKEFFEARGFIVRSNVRFDVTTNNRPGISDFDLIAVNWNPLEANQELPFILDWSSLASVDTAIVEVKGWHTTALSPSHVREGSRERDSIVGFANPDARERAKKMIGTRDPKFILVTSRLATRQASHDETVSLLSDAGVDHLILFDEILNALVTEVDGGSEYPHSESMHLLRLLKIYGKIE